MDRGVDGWLVSRWTGGWMAAPISRHTVRTCHEYGTANFDLFVFLNKEKEKNQSETEKLLSPDRRFSTKGEARF